MIEILVKIIIAAVIAIVFVVSFRDEWRRLRAREDEYDAFERSRARRQKEMDRHRIAVARACLMQEAAQIHFVGEVRTRD